MTIGNKGSAGRGKPFELKAKDRCKSSGLTAKMNEPKTHSGKSQDDTKTLSCKTQRVSDWLFRGQGVSCRLVLDPYPVTIEFL